MDGVGWMVGSAFWWWCSCKFCAFVWVYLCGCVCVCVYQRKKMRTSSDLLKGNLVIAHRVQRIVDQRAWTFPKCSSELLFHPARSLHKPKTQLFPKSCVLVSAKRALDIGFYLKRAFWAGKVETNGH